MIAPPHDGVNTLGLQRRPFIIQKLSQILYRYSLLVLANVVEHGLDPVVLLALQGCLSALNSLQVVQLLSQDLTQQRPYARVRCIQENLVVSLVPIV